MGSTERLSITVAILTPLILLTLVNSLLFIKINENKILKNIFVFLFYFILKYKVMINLILMLQKLKYLTMEILSKV